MGRRRWIHHKNLLRSELSFLPLITAEGSPPEVLLSKVDMVATAALTSETDPLSPIDCAQLGLDARSGARVSSNVNGTTACTSHVCGKTGARQIIEGSTEYGAYSYGAYSWAICGWTWKSGLSLTGASWAIAIETKMDIDPAARANCNDFRIVFLQSILFTHRRIELCWFAADASPILLARLKVLAWYFLSPDIVRSEATDTRTGSGSASKIEGPNALRWRSIMIGFRPLSVWSLSKIAHIYD